MKEYYIKILFEVHVLDKLQIEPRLKIYFETILKSFQNLYL